MKNEQTEFNWAENYDNALQYAVNKNKYTWWKLLLLGILGGMFIGIGFIGYIAIQKADLELVNGKWVHSSPLLTTFLSAAIFPVGIILVVVMGGSIFTSESLSSLAYINKKTSALDLFKGWGIIWIANFIGSALIAFLVWWSHIFADPEGREVIRGIVTGKAEMSWYITIGSGLICNIIVASTVWMSFASKQMISKILVLWFPITLFVLSGTQHIVANMFAFSLGWMEVPGEFDAMDAIFQNMIPATIGNWISGAILVPGIYTLLQIKTKREMEFKNK